MIGFQEKCLSILDKIAKFNLISPIFNEYIIHNQAESSRKALFGNINNKLYKLVQAIQKKTYHV